MKPRQDPETIPFTPEWSAKIRDLAERGDPFFQGAAWILHTIADHQPPETPGAPSCPTLAQRKDTP